MEEITKKHNELIKKYPHLKEVLTPSYNSLIELYQLQSKALESVFNSIDKKIELIKEGFFVSFQFSLNQELFLKIELKDLKKILKNGDSSKEIALNGFSDLLRINANKTPEIYGKIIKGQVIQLIENAIESDNSEDLVDIENTVALISYENFLKNITLTICNFNKKADLKPEQVVKEIPQQQRVKYTAKETALAYLFDLDTKGIKVPTNRTEGGLNAGELKIIRKEKGFEKPDTFYRGVREVLKFDRNKEHELQNISKDWLNAVRNLSNNWEQTKKYLIDKELIRER